MRKRWEKPLARLKEKHSNLTDEEALQKLRERRTTKKNIYVYVIAATKHNYYKIGVSENPKLRLKDLQTACPIPLYVLHYAPMFTEPNAYRVEALTHKEFKANNTVGEWFEFTNEEVMKAISFINKHTSKKYKDCMPVIPKKKNPFTFTSWAQLLSFYG